MKRRDKYFLTVIFLIVSQIMVSQNHAPIAVNDTVVGYPGQTIDVNVLLNDYDPDGDTISLNPFTNDSIITVTIPLLVDEDYGYKKYGYYIYDQFGNFSQDSSAAIIFVKSQNTTAKWLEANNVRALVNCFGTQFQHPGGMYDYGYLVPANSATPGIYSSQLWLTGMDEGSNIHACVNSSYADTRSFWAGPLAGTYDSAYKARWYKVWRLSKEEIEYHKDNWNNPGYEPIEDILTWPGNGDIENGEAGQIAPYYDTDNDGVYEPLQGDYPLIRGDRCVFYVLSDEYKNGDIATRGFGAEIHAMVYAFDCEEDSALYNTVFLNYQLFNRSDTAYHDCYFGYYTTWQLGDGWDNYSGCDTVLNSYFCYNADNYDESWYGASDTMWGYGNHPPALSVSFLNKTLTNYRIFIGPGLLSYPYSDYGFHNSQKGILPDSTHITYGGWGFGGSIPTNYMFPGDPLDTLNGWTEFTAGGGSIPQLSLGSHGPFSFNPGDKLSFDFALVFGRDYMGNNLTSVNTMKERIQTVRYYYENDSTPCGGSFSLGTDYYYNERILTVHPNPAKDNIYIDGLSSVDKTRVKLYDLMGRCVYDHTFSSNSINIPVTDLKQGFYIIFINNGNQVFTQKVVKQ